MIVTNLKQTIRNLLRRKGINLINLLGLVVGNLCFFLILTYVWYEKSYDGFHEGADRIYRLAYNRYSQGNRLWETANSYYPTGQYLHEHCPEVEAHTTISRNYNIIVSCITDKGEKVYFPEDKSYYASSSFFSIFSFPVLSGDIKELDKPNTVFITQQAALKYFGTTNALGKILMVNGRQTYTVAGILQNVPANTHLKFDFLFSFPTLVNQLGSWFLTSWGGLDYFYNFIRLKPGADPEKVKEQFPVMIADNHGKSLMEAGQSDEFFMQPLTRIHLYSNIEFETEKPGNGQAVTILGYFALFILLITWVNHINFSTAEAVDRAREVGIRKTMGSSRTGIIALVFTETLLLTLISIALAALLLLNLYPVLPQSEMLFPTQVFHDSRFWLVAGLPLIAGIVLTSLIPAFTLARFNPVDVLKGRMQSSSHGLYLRKALLSFQFLVSFVLITGSLIVYKQGVYLLNRDMGIDQRSVLIIKSPRIFSSDSISGTLTSVFKEKISELSWVNDFTMATDMPGREIENYESLYRQALGPTDRKDYFRIGGDEAFFRFFKARLLAGRFFSSEFPSDRQALIINEGAMKKLGYNNPTEIVGQVVRRFNNSEAVVIGVVADFHYKSIKVKPVPTVFTFQDNNLSHVALRISSQSGNLSEQLDYIERIYNSLFPSNPFEFYFLDETVKSDLQPDLNFATLFGVFSALSIFISLTGLLGLVMIYMKQTTKEMGIRKALGAGFSDIYLLVAGKFLIPVSFALLVGIPISVWGFTTWITSYYLYHISIGWIYFVVPALLLPALAALIILTQVVRTSQKITMDSLRHNS